MNRARPWLARLLRGRSLRWWGFAALVAVELPFVVLFIAQQVVQFRSAEEDAARTVHGYARVVAHAVERNIRDERGLLETLARRPGLAPRPGAACPAVFTEFPDLRPDLAHLVLLDPDGTTIRCASWPATGPYADPDPLWLQPIVSGRPFTVGTASVAHPGGSWGVPIAVPIRRPDGALAGILAARIDLAALRPIDPTALGLPPAASIDLVDATGVVAMHSGVPGRVGSAVGDEWRARLAQGEAGWRWREPRGGDWLIGAAPVENPPWHAVVVAPSSWALAATLRRLEAHLALGALLIALGTLVAVLLVRRATRPVEAIARVAEGVAGGDPKLRVIESDGPTEIVRIERGLNAMLDRLDGERAALGESEERFRTMVEASSDAVLVVGRDDVIRYASQASQTVLGWAPAELVGRALSVLQPDRLVGAHQGGMRRHAESGSRHVDWRSVTTVAVHRDGHEFPVEIAFGELRLGGEPVYAGFLRDVTERRAAERVLRERDHAMRALLDSAPAMLWTADAQGRTTYTSPRWNAYTGLPPDAALGRGWTTAVHPDDRERMLALIGSRSRFATEFTAEYRLRRADGEFRWILDQGVPRYAPDGSIEGYIGCCVDIHARVVAERRLRRQTAAYEVLTDVNEAIARVRDGPALMRRVCDSIVAYGGMIAAWAGVADAEDGALRTVASAGQIDAALSARFAAFGRSDPPVDAPEIRALREGSPVVGGDGPDGSGTPARDAVTRIRPIRSSCSLPIRAGATVVGVLSVYASEVDVFDDDLTRLLIVLADDLSFGLESMREQAGRAEAEGQLRQLAATLEQKVADRTLSLAAANQELEAFSYSVSHDLRAPLRAINGFAELAIEQAGETLDAVARGYLERVKSAAVRMSDLINDLLDLSRVTRADIHRGPVDVSAACTEIAAELAAAEPGRDVDFRIAPGLSIEADPGLARTVLSNLIGNAWKFSAGRVRARIDVDAAELGGHPAIRVRDDGAGFDMNHADKLYVPFQRLHSDREFPGTGIGLAIVRRIVVRHGGDVVATSAVGAGTTVTVSFGNAAVALA